MLGMIRPVLDLHGFLFAEISYDFHMRFIFPFLFFFASSVLAEEVELELVLLADASGSITEAEIEFQRNGYAEAITDARVLAAIRNSAYGAIAVTYVEWAANTAVVVDWTKMNPRSAVKPRGAARRSAKNKRSRTNCLWTEADK